MCIKNLLRDSGFFRMHSNKMLFDVFHASFRMDCISVYISGHVWIAVWIDKQQKAHHLGCAILLFS